MTVPIRHSFTPMCSDFAHLDSIRITALGKRAVGESTAVAGLKNSPGDLFLPFSQFRLPTTIAPVRGLHAPRAKGNQKGQARLKSLLVSNR